MQTIHKTATRDGLPYGVFDLDPAVLVHEELPRRVRCYVRGCDRIVQTPQRGVSGQICPTHGIRCHLSGNGAATYSYVDVRRNIIASADLFAGRIVGHPFKYESHRLGSENSEDALTWNVFRSLQQAGCLHEIARWITGEDFETEPELFLWGICLTDDSFEPWELLIAARRRFERHLPVVRPLTEPDIALYLPGRYLILIEAKFTSPNTFYTDGPRKDASSLTKSELLAIYQDEESRILNQRSAVEADRVFNQLWRNTVFADWMARLGGSGAKAYHANLTRAGYEQDSCAEFRRLVRPEFADRFVHIAWEDIFHLCVPNRPSLKLLGDYLVTKSTRLTKALSIQSEQLSVNEP